MKVFYRGEEGSEAARRRECHGVRTLGTSNVRAVRRQPPSYRVVVTLYL